MVVVEALEHLVKGIVDYPEDVRIRERQVPRRGTLIEVRVHPEDLGRVIGRNGRTATAFRTVAQAIAGGRTLRVDFVDLTGR